MTGASSGIGLAVVRRFLEAGATVHGIARRGHLVAELAGDAAPDEGKLHSHSLDVGDAEAVAALASELGSVDTLVSAAGVNVPRRRLEHLTVQAWDDIVRTNLSGPFYVLRAFLPTLREAQGDVVLVSSVAAAWPDHTGPAYQASKAGLLGLARGAGLDEHGNGIRICTILPGIVNTAILDRRPSPPPQELREKFVQPEDVAEAALSAVTLAHRTSVAEMTLVATQLQALGKTYQATPDLPEPSFGPVDGLVIQ
ncbi:SDR family oxidoreductase [Saccharopolyspora tripterygii]